MMNAPDSTVAAPDSTDAAPDSTVASIDSHKRSTTAKGSTVTTDTRKHSSILKRSSTKVPQRKRNFQLWSEFTHISESPRQFNENLKTEPITPELRREVKRFFDKQPPALKYRVHAPELWVVESQLPCR